MWIEIISAFAIVLLIVLIYFYGFNEEPDKKYLKKDLTRKLKSATSALDAQDDLDDLNNGEDLSKYFKDGNELLTATQFLSGKADHYSWTQSDIEIELFFNLQTFLNDYPNPVFLKKDLTITIQKKNLLIELKGESILNKTFFNEVQQDECYWQFDTDDDNSLIVWIILYKKVATKLGSYWENIFICEDQAVVQK
jgi:hypothetical protein